MDREINPTIQEMIKSRSHSFNIFNHILSPNKEVH